MWPSVAQTATFAFLTLDIFLEGEDAIRLAEQQVVRGIGTDLSRGMDRRVVSGIP